MAKYLVGILLLGMMACKSQPQRDPLREIIQQKMCPTPADADLIIEKLRPQIKVIADQQVIIHKIMVEYDAMSGELIALNDPKLPKIMLPHLKKVLQLSNQLNELARRE